MQEKFNYMLRKTLQIWKWQETIDEVIDYCKKYNVDEVMWKIDAEDFTHGLPSIEFIKSYREPLNYAKRLSKLNGIKFSINPWVTVGHDDRGIDLTSVHPKMLFLVDYTGVESTACACPLSEEWRRWLQEAYTFYASFNPNILWVEDDLRVFLHPPIRIGCFCEHHLAEFEKIIGHKISREELVEKILEEGEPHPYRKLWLDLCGNIMIDVVSGLEDAVHEVNPTVRLGLMCSNPINHAIEGRKWDKLVHGLSGGLTPVARPSLGSYNEYLPVDLIECMDIGRMTIACLPEGTMICPEVENVTFTLFSKSVKYTRLQIGLCALLGAENVTLNLYDHVGTPIAQDPEYIYMLDEVKPYLNGILSLEENKVRELGVNILHDPEGPYYTQMKENQEYKELNPDTLGFSIPLQACGIPVTFKDSSIKAITGQFFRGKAHEEIVDLLSQGLLLDITAAMTLQEMGYGDYLGIQANKVFSKNFRPLAAESYHNVKFDGEKDNYISILTLTPEELYGEVTAFKETEVLSHVVGADREELLPFITAYENTLGGRVVIYALDLSKGMSRGLKSCFLNWKRMKQFGEIVSWLGKKEKMYQVIEGAYQYTIARRYETYDYIGIANLMTDDMKQMKIKIYNLEESEIIKSIKIATVRGYEECSFERKEQTIIIQQKLMSKEFIALQIHYH
ncbi:MAG: hypothetical protein RR448_11015 [Niameybacter sp.]